ncbi:MAG: hypothetical protein V4805_11330 [Pseudomonadota bacterium]
MQTIFKDEYTRRVSGEIFTYEASHDSGKNVQWRARIFLNGDLKGEPSGSIVDNTLTGNDLRQYVVSYIESIIERGLGIDE